MSVNRQLTKSLKTIVVSTGVGAGSSDTNLTAFDTLGYTGYRICVLLGALTTGQVTAIQAQHSDTNGTYLDDAGVITGHAADADAGKLLILEVWRPSKRWIQGVVKRATQNAVVTAAWAELYSPDFQPTATVDSTNISSYKTFDSPA
jgi:hypothetical protein